MNFTRSGILDGKGQVQGSLPGVILCRSGDLQHRPEDRIGGLAGRGEILLIWVEADLWLVFEACPEIIPVWIGFFDEPRGPGIGPARQAVQLGFSLFHVGKFGKPDELRTGRWRASTFHLPRSVLPDAVHEI